MLSRGTDTNLFVWMLAWDTHAFIHRPLSIFDANTFFPLRHSLAFSENLIGGAFFAAPVIWATGNTVLAMNVVALSSVPLCALGGYFLARSVGISVWGAAVAGFVYGFCPPRFLRLDQLHLACVQWIPFSLGFLHRYLDDGRPRDLRWALAFFTLQALTTGHGGAFLTLTIVALLAYRLALGEPIALMRRMRDVGIGGVVLLLPVFYVLYEYRIVQREMGLVRTLETWRIPWTSFFASPSHVHQYVINAWLPDLHVNETAGAYLFPGFTTLLVAAAGILARRDPDLLWKRAAALLDVVAVMAAAVAIYYALNGAVRLRIDSNVIFSVRDPWRPWLLAAAALFLRWTIGRRAPLVPIPRLRRADAATFYTLLLLLSLWLSIGPPYGLWQYVYWLPGLNFILAASRFTIVSVLALSVLAGFGFDRIVGDRLSGRPAALLAAVVVLVLGLEYAAMPLEIVAQAHQAPAIDRWLARQPPPFAIAEVPIPDSPNVTVRAWQESIYMLHSMAHWQRTVHGYSGIVPEVSAELDGELTFFPDRRSIDHLRAVGVRYVVVHTDGDEPGRPAEIVRRISEFPELKLEHQESYGAVYSLASAGPSTF